MADPLTQGLACLVSSRGKNKSRRALFLWTVLLLACDEDPVRVEDRLWAVEQEERSLLALPMSSPDCVNRGYVADVLGPLAFDEEENLVGVDLLLLRLIDVEVSNAYSTPRFDLPGLEDPRALTIAPGNRLYLLDAGTRLLQLDAESGSWTRSWTLLPEGGWTGLAWLPMAMESPNGQALPMGTLVVWRPVGSGGELAWLEFVEGQALVHSLMNTPTLSAIETSRRQNELYALDAPGGELYRMRPWNHEITPVQAYACQPFHLGDIAIP